MSVEERLRQQGVKVNGTLDIRAGFKFLSRAFVDEYGVIINFKFPEDEQEEEEEEEAGASNQRQGSR